MATRVYREEVDLPAHLTSDDIRQITFFLIEHGESKAQDVSIRMTDGHVSDMDSASKMWAQVEPRDQVVAVNTSIWNADVRATFDWRPGAITLVSLEGANRVLVIGLAGMLRELVTKSSPRPVPPSSTGFGSSLVFQVGDADPSTIRIYDHDKLKSADEPKPGPIEPTTDARGWRVWWKRNRDDFMVQMIVGLVVVVAGGVWALFIR